MTDPTILGSHLPPRLAQWAGIFAAVADLLGIDPLIHAAVIDRESQGGEALAPPGPGGTGDDGHGHGLGQIDDRSHFSFIQAKGNNAQPLWKDPIFNLLYSGVVLADNWKLFGANETAWAPAIAAYNCGPGNAKEALAGISADTPATEQIALLDKATTGGDYVSDVLNRRAGFLASIA